MSDARSTAILIGSALGGTLLVYLLAELGLRWWQARRGKPASRMQPHTRYFAPPLRALLPPVALLLVLPGLRFAASLHVVVRHLLDIWLILAGAWLAVRVVVFLRDFVLSRYHIEKADNLQARRMYTQVRLVERLVVIAIWILAAAAILMSFSRVRQIGVSLLASAGVAGIVLGFAAQRTLGNLIAGIQIAIAQPMRLDDVVIVEGEWGWIEEITLTYVVVRIWDLRRLIVPISYFIEKPFQNWTRTSADLLGSVYIYADYTLPVEPLRQELTRLLEASEHWNGKVGVLQVTDAKERTIEVRALMSAADSSTAWDLRCEVREKLIAFLRERFPECLPRVRLERGQDAPSPPARAATC